MTDIKPLDARKFEVFENAQETTALGSRLCGYSGTGRLAVPISPETNAWSNTIAINCTAGRSERTRAINCANEDHRRSDLSAPVRDLISHSLSDNTKRGYTADLAAYAASGRRIPSSPETVAEYIAGMASTYKVATIARRLASISKAHRAIGADDPTKAEIVKSTMRGIRRMIGTAQREAKPILREDLFAILERMGDRRKDMRDKALLLIGFAGAFRRSELVGLDVADIEHVRQGIVIALRRSKVDQEGRGRKIGIPHGRTRWCPVKHLTDWLDHAGIEDGAIFRSINRRGHIATQRLSGEAASVIVKNRAEEAGFDPEAYSGHSLRAGLATSAVIAGVSTLSIRRTTGHASDAMLARYVRVSDMFTDNAAGTVL